MVAGRSADVLGAFLARQSPAWRKGVSVVVTDMAECYRSAVRRWLPEARHVVDRFHVVRNFAKVVVSARRDAQRTPPGQPHDPALFRNRFLLMKRLDPALGHRDGHSGKIFDAHPELGLVWGLVQRFHVIFCAPTEELANQAVGDLADAYIAAGVNLGPAITSFCRWGVRVAQLPRASGPPTPPPRASTTRSRSSSAWPTGSGHGATTSPGSSSCAPGIHRAYHLDWASGMIPEDQLTARDHQLSRRTDSLAPGSFSARLLLMIEETPLRTHQIAHNCPCGNARWIDYIQDDADTSRNLILMAGL